MYHVTYECTDESYHSESTERKSTNPMNSGLILVCGKGVLEIIS